MVYILTLFGFTLIGLVCTICIHIIGSDRGHDDELLGSQRPTAWSKTEASGGEAQREKRAKKKEKGINVIVDDHCPEVMQQSNGKAAVDSRPGSQGNWRYQLQADSLEDVAPPAARRKDQPGAGFPSTITEGALVSIRWFVIWCHDLAGARASLNRAREQRHLVSN